MHPFRFCGVKTYDSNTHLHQVLTSRYWNLVGLRKCIWKGWMDGWIYNFLGYPQL